MTNVNQILLGALVIGTVLYLNKKDEINEYFSNTHQYATWIDDVQMTPDGTSEFVNAPGRCNGNGCSNLVVEDPWSCNYVSRPTYKPDYQPRMHASGISSQIRASDPHVGLLGTADFEEMAGWGQRARDVADMAVDGDDHLAREGGVSNGGVDMNKQYSEAEECRTNMPAPDLESLKFGRDPRNPQTFMYDRLIFANKKRRNWEGADLIRGDVPILPDNKGWFQVNVHSHLDLRKGALQHICDCDDRCYMPGAKQNGRDISRTNDLQDIQYSNKEQSLAQLLQESDRVKIAQYGKVL